MLNLTILSDLHLEAYSQDFLSNIKFKNSIINPLLSENDKLSSVCLCAGDISSNTDDIINLLCWLSTQQKKVFFTPGNHEYYGKSIVKTIFNEQIEETIRKGVSHCDNVFVLQNNMVSLDEKTNLWGGTFWTDFKTTKSNIQFSQKGMNDFYQITVNERGDFLTPAYTVALHNEAKSSLIEAIKQSNQENKKLVVMTHHAPTFRGNKIEFLNHPLNAAFSSNLDDFIQRHTETIPLWVHGHKHNNIRETIGKTTIICNPMGYPDENKQQYSSLFFRLPQKEL
jgi:predicted MPP superfamily phosphohydrolase